MKDSKRIPITFPTSMLYALRTAALREHISMAAVVRQAVLAHLEKEHPTLYKDLTYNLMKQI